MDKGIIVEGSNMKLSENNFLWKNGEELKEKKSKQAEKQEEESFILMRNEQVFWL